ncbi:ATP-dependent DNA helicase DinG [Ruminococcaceae bacterium FB2012]|nr:ATP-dependent DNA helicase DinG [Ruminococcaceae bacterium FB2012]
MTPINKWENLPIETSTRMFFEKAAGSGLELRQGQLDMALEICATIKEYKPLAVEAEVGIGKSYAYLVPAVMEYIRANRQVVIATSTIALQEQLERDVKNVLEMIGVRISTTVAKGMRNYLCGQRLDRVLKSSKDDCTLNTVKRLYSFGIADRSELQMNIPDELWDKLCVEHYGAGCHSCSKNKSCPYYTMRKTVKEQHGIVICNQNMLVAHLKNLQGGGKGIFNQNGGIMIIDEAHNLESKFREAFTSSFTCEELLRTVKNCSEHAPYKRASEIKKAAFNAARHIDRLFKWLVRKVKEQQANNESDASAYYLPNDAVTRSLLTDAYQGIIDLANRSTFILADCRSLMREAMNFMGDNLVWLEMDSKLKICFCKKDIRPKISRMLFPFGKTTILTSATISDKTDGTPAEKCGYFLQNIAFPVIGNVSEPKRSPFDYDNNTILYCSSKLPRPTQDNKEEYRESAINEIVRLLEITGGKTLILFTAKEDMDYVYKRLSNMHLPYKILIQGKGSSQARQLDKFKTDVNSVILGTGTYWEGINVEGEALSQVIIFKLPFPVPDPIIDYKMSLVKDKVKEVAVPEMIIKLKQGTGRLIRSSTDNGIVSILDPRASRKEKCFYRNTILGALCEKNSTEDIRKIKNFWNRLNAQKEAV